MRSYEQDVDEGLRLTWAVIEDLDRTYGKAPVRDAKAEEKIWQSSCGSCARVIEAVPKTLGCETTDKKRPEPVV